MCEPNGCVNLIQNFSLIKVIDQRGLVFISIWHPAIYHITEINRFRESPLISNNSLVPVEFFFETIHYLSDFSPKLFNLNNSFTVLPFFDSLHEGGVAEEYKAVCDK
ncbi:hypothetical protein MXB_5483 [Myxobolus squamalis]|nr:hypothetical protein MXB_5483 [Myxobolus squamalis]